LRARLLQARAVAATAAVLLVAIGCGDELGDFREHELRPLEREAQQDRAALAATLQAVEIRDRAGARQLESRLKSLEQTHAELANLEPPGEYQATYNRFLSANEVFVAQMRKFAAALREGDRTAMRAASGAAKRAISAAERAIQPLHE
jgi:hypothetical protein